jgi:hypothetical protein
MRIEAVVISVGYDDYLTETLPRTLPLFDRVIVVTSESDTRTQEVCRRLSCPFYATDCFYQDGAKFNKYRGIEFGHMMTRHNSWVVNLDADTYLPPLARQWLDRKLTDPAAIYGVDRVNCVGYDRWRSHVAAGETGHDYFCRVQVPAGMPLGERIAMRDNGGYVPIGFFQAFHQSTGRKQPIVSGTAEHGDVAFAMQWPEGRRHLIPEVIAVHLMSDKAPLGSNWGGRRTARFGPPYGARAGAVPV